LDHFSMIEGVAANEETLLTLWLFLFCHIFQEVANVLLLGAQLIWLDYYVVAILRGDKVCMRVIAEFVLLVPTQIGGHIG
jgi:hypothetical protein